MPIFSSRRSRLDGLTREEEKRRDVLAPEVMRRAAERSEPEGDAVVAVLREKMEGEPLDPLWPLLLGRQMMIQQRHGEAIEAFEAALARDAGEVRAHYGAGMACYQAAEYKLEYGASATDGGAPASPTAGSLLQEALRHFRRAMELTPDKRERDELASAAAVVQRVVGRKRGRL